jgi:hypothetical protein
MFGLALQFLLGRLWCGGGCCGTGETVVVGVKEQGKTFGFGFRGEFEYAGGGGITNKTSGLQAARENQSKKKNK